MGEVGNCSARWSGSVGRRSHDALVRQGRLCGTDRAINARGSGRLQSVAPDAMGERAF